MNHLGEALEKVRDTLADLAVAAFADDGLRACGDDAMLEVLACAGAIQRSAEAVMVEAVAQMLDRDAAAPHPDRIRVRHGCRNMNELIQRATLVSHRTATDMLTAANAVQQETALTTGQVLPAQFPAMRNALATGAVGVDGLVAVGGAFRGCAIGRAGLLAADTELAASARGDGVDAAPPATADELRAQAAVWAAYLDQDGSEPAESSALRKRGFTIGRRRDDGLVPVRGELLPDVAAQLQREFDAVLNPKVDGAPAVTAGAGPWFTETAERTDPDQPPEATADSRSRAQQQHDALATLLHAAAASGALPTLGGAAPTLVVTVREEDLATGRGFAHLPGEDRPVPLGVARHIACTGAIQRVVMNENGRIVALGTQERVFNHHQRRAITARDGGCLIPGCSVPPAWCEIHHVHEHVRGGPTHTDNGVLLCWFHHRTIDTGGWMIRINQGVPEVRGPAWWDPTRRWRPATKSPTRRRDHLALRM